MTFVSHARNFEDVMLWRVLRHVEYGFWIDVRTGGPDLSSVTYAFSERGWRGVNVRRAAASFRHLRQTRPRDITLCAIVTGETTASGHTGGGPAMTTLAAIQAAHADGPVHFLKLAVEGDEVAVLAAAGLTRFRPWIIVVESGAPASEIAARAAGKEALREVGYQCVYFDGLNRFYVAAEHMVDLGPGFRTPPNVFDDFIQTNDPEGRRAAVAMTTQTSALTDALKRDLERTLQHLADAQVALVEAREEAREARRLLEAMRTSTFWKLTWPLRSFVYRARKLLRRGDKVQPAVAGMAGVAETYAPAASWDRTVLRGLDEAEVLSVQINAALAPRVRT